ncbi:MHYT domain-containing protein, NO-binding membrane sensor [Noviherbaspirillum humi]|uniref:Virulence sensor protein BvgS n=1 Tax=Noviherbaspirillum humi TaxID=1688639 RepID=A0A239LPH6_9BURK|nr:MHYT domain-containing protein [Noviherbaspirillum humi]SNT32456.1 MHYT domain-containing protein, NO-binding membrane sensor [Noviherbaspirillum humi]
MLASRYEMPLVLISILVAIFASYTALSLAERVTRSAGRAARLWIAGGALAMGTGIWAMHFIGMLAFRLPIAIGFDFTITLLSLLLPILVSGMALWQVSQPQLPRKRLVAGALLMGLGINAMHYTGMAAMRMDPGIHYDSRLFAASVVIAVLASGAALWIAFRLRGNLPNVWQPRAGAAILMGIAIAGMHYTGMAAASFPLGSVCLAAGAGFSLDGLAIMVILATFGVLGVTMMASIYDAKLEARSRILAMSVATAEERQQLLLREREARAEAERLSDMKDEFLATLSHELRTPLNAVLGWTQLLRMKRGDEATLARGLETIERNARAQAQLIDDLLDMSRILSGKIRIEMQRVDLAACVAAALETVRPAAMAKSIRLQAELAPNAGTVSGDPNRLQQVLWNLLSNAVKFTPEGGMVAISLTVEGDDAVVTVTDSGIGIAPDFLPHVFDRFRQADASTTRQHGGLGLGLSIVRHLAELHGGAVSASSSGAGQGATFTLRLPVAGSDAAVRAEKTDPGQASRDLPAARDLGNLSGIRVLVVDDQDDARDLVERILQNCGAVTIGASSAGQALSLVEQAPPDVIVSDIGMPGMDGFEFMRRVRAFGAARGGDVPAVALTAFSRAEDQKRALQAGFNHYLSKPFEPADLVDCVAGLTTQARAANPVQ